MEFELHTDIDTLTNLSSNHGLSYDEIYQLILKSTDYELPWGGLKQSVKSKSPVFSWLGRRYSEESESYSSDSSDYSKNDEQTVTTVSGLDIADVPTSYEIKGLKDYEIPVIGTYVDKKVVPGFKYHVRTLPKQKYLFSGESKILLSIGRGYGKRITFEDDNNSSGSYFYSDSNQDGYGFSLDVLESGETFDIHAARDGRKVAEAVIKSIGKFQKDIQTEVGEDGRVVKHVAVSFKCRTDYCMDTHLPRRPTSDRLQLTGVAVVERKNKKAFAKTVAIKNLVLPDIGPCVFYN